jgi:carboxypeptidase D
VNFDIGESYAGLLPISSAPDAGKLYFWFFPSSNPNATDDLTIWLNGGPGCSSLEGFLQENGPFLWQYGTFKPVKNPWTWVNLTNMLWVEQPVGTGFTQGVSTETSEEEVAKSFLGFFKNFADTFNFKNKKIYITGESYAGMYVPYIADAMFNKNDTTYFDVHGTMIYDPSINSDAGQLCSRILVKFISLTIPSVLANVPAVPYVNAFDNIFNLNDTYMADLQDRHKKCGYADFIDKYLVFPPVPGKMPSAPQTRRPGCNIWRDVQNAVTKVNPCFDVYDISTTCQ